MDDPDADISYYRTSIYFYFNFSCNVYVIIHDTTGDTIGYYDNDKALRSVRSSTLRQSLRRRDSWKLLTKRPLRWVQAMTRWARVHTATESEWLTVKDTAVEEGNAGEKGFHDNCGQRDRQLRLLSGAYICDETKTKLKRTQTTLEYYKFI